MEDEIEIQTDPREIVDRVDDMLAWMRVASPGADCDHGSRRYFVEGYRRAEPLISVGRREVGVMVPSGVRSDRSASDTVAWAADSLAAQVHRVGAKLLKQLGERPCFGAITESSGAPELIYVNGGENVDDLRVDRGLRGVTYRLDGVYLLSGTEAATVRRRLRFPSSARVLALQSHAIINDGRSASGLTFVGHDENLGWLSDEGQVSARGVDADGGFGHLAVSEVFRLLMRQYRRRSDWVVELAAAKERTGVGLATDGEGAAALVRELKDKSPDPKRIVHWVSEHMRRRRDGGESTVRAHMRGKQTFRVGRHWATVYPSRVDIERACNGSRFDVHTRRAS